MYLRTRSRLELYWNLNSHSHGVSPISHEEAVRAILAVEDCLVKGGVEALKRHILPNIPSETRFPFFFYELRKKSGVIPLVYSVQEMVRKIKEYKQPVRLATEEAVLTQSVLKPFVPELAWNYLEQILGMLNVHFGIKDPRKSVAGDCRVDRQNQVAYVTINSMQNKWKFLCVLLHEIAHVLNHAQHSDHDVYWKIIYAALLADFYDFFPQEYQSELLWGMTHTPASSRPTNYNGRAVLFGVENIQPAEVRAMEIAKIIQVRQSIASANVECENAQSLRPHAELEKKDGRYVAYINEDQMAPDDLPYDFSFSRESISHKLELRRQFRGVLYIPIDLCADKRFLHLYDKLPTRSKFYLMTCYGIVYGTGALRYAERTMRDWLSGRVDGWAPLRFFEIVPLVFPLNRRKELCKVILDASDEISQVQYRYPEGRVKLTILSLAAFIEHRKWIASIVSLYGNRAADDFDYEKRYNISAKYDIVWLAQPDMIEYREQLSQKKREEIYNQVAQLESQLDYAENCFRKTGTAEIVISFPDREYRVKIVSKIRYFFRWIAVSLGLADDFVLNQ